MGDSGYPFCRANPANCVVAHRERVDWIVIHTMQAPCVVGRAQHCADEFAKVLPKPKSAHYSVDPSTVIQSVHEYDVAWHAPGANRRGVGIEHAGYASVAGVDSPTDWTTPEAQDMLALSATLCAAICKRWGIPVVKVGSSGLLANQRGITGHIDCTDAWHKSDHRDPGPTWPWDSFVAAIQAEREKLG